MAAPVDVNPWPDRLLLSAVASGAIAACVIAAVLLKPTTDTLLLLNPGPESARVDVAVLTGSGAQRPGYMRDLTVKAGARRRIELKELGAMLLVYLVAPSLVLLSCALIIVPLRATGSSRARRAGVNCWMCPSSASS